MPKKYEPVIGLEIHAQLTTESKIFCDCSTEFGDKSNTHVCPVCLGYPGTLPVLNKKVVEYALRMASACECDINRSFHFARKNYFYPDLPKGYQITQDSTPIATDGKLDIETENETKSIGLERIHIEEDSGKSKHPRSPHIQDTFVDMNRCGIPLMEIVTKPEINSPQEAVSFLKKLKRVLEYLDICAGNMEEANLRCDANLSLKERGGKEMGDRTEIKNLNSFRHLKKALQYESKRHQEVLEQGDKINVNTLQWDELKGETKVMRTKEEASDYRYFVEPDLLNFTIPRNFIDEVADNLPELAEEKKHRFQEEYDLSKDIAEMLTSKRAIADYFEKSLENCEATPKEVGNWIVTEVFRLTKEEKVTISDAPPSDVFLNLIKRDKLSQNMAKELYEKAFLKDKFEYEGWLEKQKIHQKFRKQIKDFITKEGLKQVSDEQKLAQIIDEILSENPEEVERYKDGEKKLLSFFMGQVMKATKGQANPQLANKLIKKKLGS